METNGQGLTKEEKIMFSILGIILIIAIGVLIIGRISSNDRKLDDNKTPITEQSEKKEEIIDDNTNEPEDILIEDETEEEEEIYYPVVNIPSSPGTNIEEKPIRSPVVKPTNLDWTFKTTMITNAYNGDVITIEKNVLLSNGEDREATISVSKYEQNTWIPVDISTNTFMATTGIYKYIYSCGSYTKELLLTVKDRFEIESISLLKLNEVLDENLTITQEEFTKYQSILNDTLYENTEGINKLTINNYIVTNNLLPILVTTNTDLTNQVLSTTKEGVTITQEQQDWYEQITPNSIIIWLDLNTIDTTNNIIDINVDGVTYNLELNIIINNFQEISTTPEQGELDNEENVDGPVVEEDSNEDEKEEQQPPEEDNIIEEDNSNQEEEEELDPLEPTEDTQIENSSNDQESSNTQTIEEETLQPGTDNLSTYSP